MVQREAPCIFCGFNGGGYWQAGTHSPKCPWYKIGGAAEREEKFSGAIKKMFHDYAALEQRCKELAQQVTDLEEDARRFPTLAEFENTKDDNERLYSENAELKERLRIYESHRRI